MVWVHYLKKMVELSVIIHFFLHFLDKYIWSVLEKKSENAVVS